MSRPIVHDDDLSHFEFETESFTGGELAAIARYREETAGIPDTFDCFDTASVREVFEDAGDAHALAQFRLRTYAVLLNRWFLAIDSLLGNMLTCTAELTNYSTAAQRFLNTEAEKYHRTRQDFEYHVTVAALGLDTTPTGDYPWPTRTLNLPMQSLDQ